MCLVTRNMQKQKLVYDNNETWEILQFCESRKVGNLQTFIEKFI